MTTFIAPYIEEGEYKCRCCGKLPPSFGSVYYGQPATCFQVLFGYFQKIREKWGQPIPINSGYRCISHNTAIGGEPNSIHTFGLALDLDFHDKQDTEKAFTMITDLYKELRIGKYLNDHFIHCDVGYLIFPKASPDWAEGARWTK